MNKEDIIQLMEDKFDEITEKEFDNFNYEDETAVYINGETLYFKPKQKFPIVFEDEFRRI